MSQYYSKLANGSINIIYPSKYVGIGTTNPGYKLDVAGDARINDSGAANGTASETMRVVNTAAGATSSYVYIGASSGTDWKLGKNVPGTLSRTNFDITTHTGVFGLTVDTYGKVGIGTTTPYTKLQVDNTLGIYSTDTTTGGQIYLGSSDFYNGSYYNSAPGIGAIISTGCSQPNGLGFYTYTGSANSRTEVMRIENNCNVGIGTTDPAGARLVIGEGPGANNLRLLGRAADGWSFIQLRDASNTSNYAEIGARSTELRFYQGGTQYQTVIGGKVLIGRTSCLNTGSNLQVDNAIALGSSLYTFSQVVGGADLELISNANPANIGVDSNIIFKLGTSGGGGPVERMRIVSTGNVGIGTTSPGGLLHLHSDGGNACGSFLLLKHANNNNTDIIGTIEFANNLGKTACIQAGTTGNCQSGYMSFSTELCGTASEVMRITEDSKVGIGTTSPDSKLEIVAANGSPALKLSRDVSGTVYNYGQFINSGSDFRINAIANIFLNADSDSNSTSVDRVIKFGNRGVEYARIQHEGKVGIGTTDPGYKLDVATSNGDGIKLNHSDGWPSIVLATKVSETVADSLSAHSSIYTTTPWTSGEWPFNTANGEYGALVLQSRDNGNGGIIFRTGTGSGYSNRLVVRETGNVGIGTTDPSQKLHVYNGRIAVTDGYNIGDTDANTGMFVSSDYFYVQTAGTTRMTVADNGKVGIGTASPANKLNVCGCIGIQVSQCIGSGSIFGTSASASWAALELYNASNGFTSLNNQNYGIYLCTNSNPRLTIKQDGTVGIGTTDPGYRLDVCNATTADSGSVVARIKGSNDSGLIIEGANNETATNYGPGRTGSKLILRNLDSTAGNYTLLANYNATGYVNAGISFVNVAHGVTGVTEGSIEFFTRNTTSNYTKQMTLSEDGALRLTQYGSCTFSGTPTHYLTVDSSGNVIEELISSGTPTGSGTTGYVPKWTGSVALGDSILKSNANNVILGGCTVSSSNVCLHISSSSNSYNPSILFGYWTGAYDSGMWRITSCHTASCTLAIEQVTSGSAATNKSVYIDSCGRVGVGTTNPSYKMDLYGDLRISNSPETKIVFRETIATDTYADRWTIGNDDAVNNAFVISCGANFDTPRLVVLDTGNVGIGTTDPQVKLEVKGDGEGINLCSNDYMLSRIIPRGSGAALDGGLFSLFCTGIECVRIDGGGNSWIAGGYVGIGTNAVNYPLEVTRNNGGLVSRIYNTNTNGEGVLIRAGDASCKTRAFQVAATDDTKRFTINSDGTVGIGRTDPSNPLEVQWPGDMGVMIRSTSCHSSLYLHACCTGTSGNYIRMHAQNYCYWINHQYNGCLMFRPNATGTVNNQIYFNQNSWVGIGTDAPSTRLDVVNSNCNADHGIRVLNSTANSSANACIRIDGYAGSCLDFARNGGDRWRLNRIAFSDDLELNAYGTSGAGSVMYWDYDTGNVGIGTTSPGYKLDVTSSSNTTFRTATTGTDRAEVAILKNSGTAQQWTLSVAGSANGYGIADKYFYIADTTGGTTPLVIDKSGNVGIGITDPDVKLHVEVASTNSQFRLARTGTATGEFDIYTNSDTLYVKNVGGGNTIPFCIDQNVYATNKVAIKTTTLASSNNFHVSSGTTGSASKSSIAVVSVADNSTFSNGVAALHVINSGNRGTKGHGSGSDLLRLEFSDCIHTLFDKNGNVGIGTTNPTEKLHICNGQIRHSCNSNNYLCADGDAWHVCADFNLRLCADYNNNNSGPYSNIIMFTDGANERMRVTYGGCVGIGTNSPNTTLHTYSSTAVAGERNIPIDVLTLETEHTGDTEYNGFGQGLVFRGSTYNNNTQRTIGRILHQINDDSITTTRGTSMSFQTLSSATASSPDTKLHINYNGNVGIGTTSPTEKLEVAGNIIAKDSGFLAGTDGDKDGFVFHDLATGGGNYWGYQGFTGSSRLSIVTDGSERLTVDTNGKVGIGTTDPAKKLDVAGCVVVRGAGTCVANAGTGELQIGYGYGAPGSAGTVTRLAIQPYAHTGGPWKFDARDTSPNAYLDILYGSSNAVTILHDGSVGIGTTNPTARLDVKSSIIVRDTNSDLTHVHLQSNATEGVLRLRNGANWGFIARGSGNNPYIGAYSGGSLNIVGFTSADASSFNSALTIFDFANSRVGIGTTSPNSLLHVHSTGTCATFTNIAHFRSGPDENATGSEIFIGHQGNSRGLIIQGGRGGEGAIADDTAVAHFCLNRSGGTIPSSTQDHIMTFRQGGFVGIGTTEAGTNTGKLFVGTPPTTGSAAIAQFGGFIRTNYILTHDSNYGIHPNTTCTGQLGYTAAVYKCAHICKIIAYGGICPSDDGNRPLGGSTYRWSNVHTVCTTTGAIFESNLCTCDIGNCPKGSVVVWRDGKLQGTTQEYDHRVMGITAPDSDSPIVMGAEPILVTGDIEEGDPIVTSSIINHGMKGDRSCDLHGRVIGEALESGSGDSYTIMGMVRKF